MKVYLATWLSDVTVGNALTKKKANCRLLSYHFLRQHEDVNTHLRRYVKTGRTDTRKKSQQ